MLEHRGDDRPDGAAAREVETLERPLCRVVGRACGEVAPKLADEEARMIRVRDREADRVLPGESSSPAEDRLLARVVVARVVAEVHVAGAGLPVVAEAGQCACLFADVGLAVASPRAEGEELHHLARVVLVRRPARVVAPVQPQQHRRIPRHVEQQLLKGAEAVLAEQLVLAEHQALRVDAIVRRREPVVPDEGHALDKGPRGAHHPIEPPQVVVPPRVERGERAPLVVCRSRPDELLLPWIRERVHRAVETELRQRLGLALAGAEAGTPKQPLGLSDTEPSCVGGYQRQTLHRDHRAGRGRS